jgi:glycosyltransferase involved in cell wall biosynthesis
MGLENLLLAFSEVVRENKDLVLVIGGIGFLEQNLKNLSHKLGLDNNVKFTGLISDELLPNYYQVADLFVLPTLALEGFGLVTIEAMACGTPVLGTPIGGTVEILSELGMLFDSNTPESIAKKIKEYLGRDEKEIESLSQRCREYVLSKYSLKKETDKIENIFLSLTKHD